MIYSCIQSLSNTFFFNFFFYKLIPRLPEHVFLGSWVRIDNVSMTVFRAGTLRCAEPAKVLSTPATHRIAAVDSRYSKTAARTRLGHLRDILQVLVTVLDCINFLTGPLSMVVLLGILGVYTLLVVDTLPVLLTAAVSDTEHCRAPIALAYIVSLFDILWKIHQFASKRESDSEIAVGTQNSVWCNLTHFDVPLISIELLLHEIEPLFESLDTVLVPLNIIFRAVTLLDSLL